MTNTEALIYGKNPLQHIVGLEIESTHAVVFTEKDGIVSSQEIPHKYWMLSNEKLGIDWVRMEGEQHYKFGKQYDHYWKLRADREKFKEKDLYQITNPTEAILVKDGYSYYKGLQPAEVSILCFDIETNGVTQNDDSRVFLIANTLRINGEIHRKLFAYDEFENDGEMIKAWCNWVQETDPSIMCGHNIYSFDFPYLKHVASIHNTDLFLGRDGSKAKFSNFEAKYRVDGSRDLHYHKVNIYGREICDTMFLAYKYDIGRKYESYGLKPIIAQEKLEKEGRVFYDAGTIKDNYMIPEEWAKIKAYAIDDGDDALSLFDLMVPPFFYMAQMIPKPFQLIIESASGSQLNVLMVRSYLQNKHSIPKQDEAVDFEGAISFGNPGVYANSVSLDIASLYPSIMLQYEVHSPTKDPKKHLVHLLNYLRTERLKNKKLAKDTGLDKYKHLDGSLKILINSLYGFLGASGLNYNFPQGAAFVTEKGREILTQSMDWAKEKGFEVVKGDTDSISIYKGGEEFSDAEIDSLTNELNSVLPEHINFELDAVYDVLAVFKAKNYAYREGEKISIRGSALKGSTKSPAFKQYMKETINGFLYLKTNEDRQQNYLKYAKEICNLKTVDDIKKYSARKTISSKVLESERTNETKVMDALEGKEYSEGDRITVYYRQDDSLALTEDFDGDYNVTRLHKNLYDTTKVFDTIMDVKELFPNYALKKNKKLLEEL